MPDCILCKKELGKYPRLRDHVHTYCLDALRIELMGIRREYKYRHHLKVSDKDVRYSYVA